MCSFMRIYLARAPLLAVTLFIGLGSSENLLAELKIGSPLEIRPPIDLDATDDASVARGNPDGNGGSSTSMIVRNRYGHPSHPDKWQTDILIRFDVSSVPAGSVITSAKVYLYYYENWDSDASGRELNMYRATTQWEESSVTFGNQPTTTPVPSTHATVPESPGAWMTWDVTSDVKAMIEGQTRNYGWRITDENRWGDFDIPIVRFYTKEHGTDTPRLVIEFAE